MQRTEGGKDHVEGVEGARTRLSTLWPGSGEARDARERSAHAASWEASAGSPFTLGDQKREGSGALRAPGRVPGDSPGASRDPSFTSQDKPLCLPASEPRLATGPPPVPGGLSSRRQRKQGKFVLLATAGRSQGPGACRPGLLRAGVAVTAHGSAPGTRPQFRLRTRARLRGQQLEATANC